MPARSSKKACHSSRLASAAGLAGEISPSTSSSFSAVCPAKVANVATVGAVSGRSVAGLASWPAQLHFRQLEAAMGHQLILRSTEAKSARPSRGLLKPLMRDEDGNGFIGRGFRASCKRPELQHVPKATWRWHSRVPWRRSTWLRGAAQPRNTSTILMVNLKRMRGPNCPKPMRGCGEHASASQEGSSSRSYPDCPRT